MTAQGGVSAGTPPAYFTAAICDYAAALLAVFGIGAALVARERTGRGKREGAPARIGSTATDRFFRCADDAWLKPSVSTVDQWAALVACLGDVALADVSAGEALRAEPRGIVAELLEERFASAPIAAWQAMLHGAGVPAAPIVRPPGLFNDAQMLANDLIVEHQHAG